MLRAIGRYFLLFARGWPWRLRLRWRRDNRRRSGCRSGARLRPDAATPTLKVQANEVDLVFTVTDKNGKFITGLNQSSFGLLDNRMPPEAVLHFYQQTNLPLRVGIMLDTSSSIRQRFQFEQESAITFLLQVLHRNDRAFVEGFDVQTDVEQGFTNNIDLLSQGIHRLRPGGGTALYDSLYSTCKDQMLTLREDGRGAQGDRPGVGRRRRL